MRFHFDRGLKLTDIDLAIDVRRRQPRGFMSHAHADHIARHEVGYCTSATARLYRHRMGPANRIVPLDFHEPYEWRNLRLTTLPAGHILGSAMLLAESETGSLLYTGDFKLGDSATAEPAELRRADVLVMETTFGKPQYRLPPRSEVIEQLVELLHNTLSAGRTPVIHAYTLGKSQELTKIVTSHGFQVRQHREVFRVSSVYAELGCNLGEFALYDEHEAGDFVVIAPPRSQRGGHLQNVRRPLRITLTGWAIDPAAKHRLGVDHALPLSDHADYDELFQAVEIVSPQVVYCTHGPESFVEALQAAGVNARVLGGATQLRLF